MRCEASSWTSIVAGVCLPSGIWREINLHLEARPHRVVDGTLLSLLASALSLSRCTRPAFSSDDSGISVLFGADRPAATSSRENEVLVAGSPCRARRGTSRRRRTRPRPRWPARPSPPPLAAVARLPARHNHVGGARADAGVVDLERAHLAPARRQLVVAQQRRRRLGSQRRSSGRRRRISATSSSIVTAASTSSATHWRCADPGRRGRAPMFLSSRDQRRAHDRVAAGAGTRRTCGRVDRRDRRPALSVLLNSQIAVVFVADAALWAGGRRARRAPCCCCCSSFCGDHAESSLRRAP